MAVRTGIHARRWAAAAAVAITVVLALTGCGAPSWNYVTNKEERTYAKVPVAWQDVSSGLVPGESMFSFSADGIAWIRAFDAAGSATIDHVVGNAAPGDPTMIVLVFHVPPALRGSVDLDYLRDAVLPVSPRARSMLPPGLPLTDFKLYADETLTPGDGLRGVRTLYSYVLGNSAPQVFYLTAYTNDDASKVYVNFIRCSLDCFKRDGNQINDVASSFTVREKL